MIARWVEAPGMCDRDGVGESDRITIAEVRARRTDPVWRRRHQLADLRGLSLVVGLLVLPPLAWLFWRPLGLGLAITVLVAGAAALWSSGPKVGLERRTSVLVAIPLLNLVVLVPAVWRSAHLGLQRWKGPLQPGWSDGVWVVAAVVGVACWLGAAALLVLSLP